MSAQPVVVGLSAEDADVIIALACSLDEKPGSNWVQGAGGLPEYICQVAKAIKKDGKSTSTAIAMAISRIKKWAATGSAETKAKAAKALSQWEALKAKSGKGSKVKTTNEASDNDNILVMLSTTEWSMDEVRTAFEARQSEVRQKNRQQGPTTARDDLYYAYVSEVWTNHVIVKGDGPSRKVYKIPYSVKDTTVTFAEPKEVKATYVEVARDSDTEQGLTDERLKELMTLCGPCDSESHTDKVLRLANEFAVRTNVSGTEKASRWAI